MYRMHRRLSTTVMRAIALAATVAAPAGAQGVWTDWTAGTAGANSTAVGTMTFAGPQVVVVNYSGEIYGIQTTCGTDYWTPTATYDAPGISRPTGCDMIQLVGGANTGLHTLSFSQPLVNPFFAVLSLGGGNAASYNFNAPFDIVSQGAGYFGGGPASLTELAGDILSGQEGNGTIQFQGTYSSISWTVPNGETWHAFTVGAAGVGTLQSTVPEPSTVALLGIGMVGVGAVARRRTRKQAA
jgi:hypothetical protein